MLELPDALPRKRPRVVLIAHDIAPFGGMERAMYELIMGARDNVDFTVVSTTLAEDLRPFVRWRRVPTLRRPFAVKFSVFFVLAGFCYRRGRADVVHTLGAIVPRRADLMSVHFCHAAYRADTRATDLEAGQPRLRRLNTALAFQLGLRTEQALTNSRWAGRATAVSNGGARELARFYPDLAVTVIPNGVDHARFHPAPHTRSATRLNAGVADGDVVALFIGGRWSQKGLEITIRGLALAQAGLSQPLRLWVAGSGDIRRYQAIANALGVGDRIHFFGYVADPERLYQAADIFVLPSAYETFCMVAYEAASSALPVVATAVNGVDDLLQGNQAGILIEATAESVGTALGTLAGDPDLRHQMGTAGRHVVAELTWQSSVEQTVATYEELVSEGRKGR
jgi:UDP-glucose:(heptosyl)LPS alpha-1,3-glucosyltransferase